MARGGGFVSKMSRSTDSASLADAFDRGRGEVSPSTQEARDRQVLAHEVKWLRDKLATCITSLISQDKASLSQRERVKEKVAALDKRKFHHSACSIDLGECDCGLSEKIREVVADLNIPISATKDGFKRGKVLREGKEVEIRQSDFIFEDDGDTYIIFGWKPPDGVDAERIPFIARAIARSRLSNGSPTVVKLSRNWSDETPESDPILKRLPGSYGSRQ